MFEPFFQNEGAGDANFIGNGQPNLGPKRGVASARSGGRCARNAVVVDVRLLLVTICRLLQTLRVDDDTSLLEL
eukprot:8018803-Pyramimonas_sp.AAC.1